MASRRILIDTGPLVALMSVDDAQHRICRDTFAALAPPLFTCWPVITEATWLLRRHPAALDKLFRGFEAGMLELLPLDAEAVGWIAGFLRRYRSIDAQPAAAALVYLAEREGIATVFTTDRRDFSVYRIERGRALKLIPEVR